MQEDQGTMKLATMMKYSCLVAENCTAAMENALLNMKLLCDLNDHQVKEVIPIMQSFLQSVLTEMIELVNKLDDES